MQVSFIHTRHHSRARKSTYQYLFSHPYYSNRVKYRTVAKNLLQTCYYRKISLCAKISLLCMFTEFCYGSVDSTTRLLFRADRSFCHANSSGWCGRLSSACIPFNGEVRLRSSSDTMWPVLSDIVWFPRRSCIHELCLHWQWWNRDPIFVFGLLFTNREAGWIFHGSQ